MTEKEREKGTGREGEGEKERMKEGDGLRDIKKVSRALRTGGRR